MAYGMEVSHQSNIYLIISEVLFHDSTIYFSMISGLLYTSVLKGRGYQKFYKSKLKNVVAPYLFFTLLFSLLTREFQPQPSLEAYGSAIVSNFFLGQAQSIYWYIPVLFVLYLLTPLLDYLLKTRSVNKLFYLVLLLPFFFSRTAVDLSFQTLIYFVGSYALGMWLGENLEEYLDYFKNKSKLLLGIALSTSIALVVCYLNGIDYVWKIDVLESLYYPQKVAITLLVLNWYRQKSEQPGRLAKFADDSFAIYFIHFFFIAVISFSLIHGVLPFGPPLNFLVASVVALIIGLLLSLGFIKLFQKILGKYSRMIIGS